MSDWAASSNIAGLRISLVKAEKAVNAREVRLETIEDEMRRIDDQQHLIRVAWYRDLDHAHRTRSQVPCGKESLEESRYLGRKTIGLSEEVEKVKQELNELKVARDSIKNKIYSFAGCSMAWIMPG